jgi:hypothetical protein
VREGMNMKNNSQSSVVELVENVRLFCRQAQKAFESRLIFQRIFESHDGLHGDPWDYQLPEEGAAMEKTCPYFFEWLFVTLRSHVLLEAAKLMDPKETRVRGQDRENITFEWIESHIQDQQIVADLMALRVGDFRPHIKEERDRSISHSDVEYLRGSGTVGEFPEEADRTFYSNLQRYVDILYDHVIGGPFPLKEGMIINDVGTLLHCLKKPSP